MRLLFVWVTLKVSGFFCVVLFLLANPCMVKTIAKKVCVVIPVCV